jgi:hypothetical protein
VERYVDIESFSDEELTELALAADPDQPLAADAVPLSLRAGEHLDLLPRWYMPPVLATGASRRRKTIIFLIVATLVAIEALGLCSVFGQVVIG